MMNNAQRTFTTSHGTELPLLNLKGKEYLEVKYRLVWFREEHPSWSIETEFVSMTDRSACARAIIRDETGRVIATSHKTETPSSFPDFVEKAETGAIGRALALIGFGTQFCADELDEGDRIVDAPAVGLKRTLAAPKITHASSVSEAGARTGTDLGEYQIRFGKKYLGKRLKDIARDEIEGYLEWLEDNAAKKGMGLTPEVTLLKAAVDRYYHPETFDDPASVEPNDALANEALAAESTQAS